MIGLLGKKRGMSSIFDNGRLTPVTVIEVGPCPVVQIKTTETDGYNAIQLGFGKRDPKRTIKPMAGHTKKAGVDPVKVLKEFRGFSGEVTPGQIFTIDLFKVGEKVDIIGTSKGKGYAGVIKRHHFQRPNQTHGTHEAFRGPGSIGSHSDPARTWPGQRMAGRMGGSRVTTKNLQIIGLDLEHGLLLVRGAVPGAQGGILTVCKSKKGS